MTTSLPKSSGHYQTGCWWDKICAWQPKALALMVVASASAFGICPASYAPIPAVFYTPETSLGGGAALVISRTCQTGTSELSEVGGAAENKKSSTLIPAYFHTAKNQSIGRLFLLNYSSDAAWRFDGAISRTVFPDTFYGVGNNTEIADAELFLERYYALNFDAQYAIWSDFYVGPAYRFDIANIEQQEPGGRLESGGVVGANRGKLQGIGVSAVYDGRDNEFSPETGLRTDLSVIPYKLASDFDVTQILLRQRVYWTVADGHVVAFEGRAEALLGEAPFRKLALLGGQYLLPGYFLGRFRDRSLAAAQLQYRSKVTDRFAAAFLVGFGSVAPHWTELDAAKRHVSLALGIRYIVDQSTRLPIRLDYGQGNDSAGSYFGAGEIF